MSLFYILYHKDAGVVLLLLNLLLWTIYFKILYVFYMSPCISNSSASACAYYAGTGSGRVIKPDPESMALRMGWFLGKICAYVVLYSNYSVR